MSSPLVVFTTLHFGASCLQIFNLIYDGGHSRVLCARRMGFFARNSRPNQGRCTRVIHESRFLRLLMLMLALGAGFRSQATGQTFNTVYSFTGASDGGNPLDGLVFSSGYLYGTGSSGGSSGSGVVYKVSSTSGQQTVVYSFAGGAD